MPAAALESASTNALGTAVAVGTTHGESRAVVAWNLATGEQLWSVAADPMTRPQILGDVVVTSDRLSVFALDLNTGQRLWEEELETGVPFVGAAREGSRLTYVQSVGAAGGATRIGQVRCVNARSGSEIWEHRIAGVLGEPAMQGGYVFVPWDRQNMAILSAETGIEQARFRSTDDVIAWVRASSAGVFYGARGLYRFDVASHSGTREGSIYRASPIQNAPQDPLIEADGFFPKPGTRSARGRIRIYTGMTPSHELVPQDSRFYLVYFRYVFGFDNDGALQWVTLLDQDVINAQAVTGGLLTVGEQGAVRVLHAVTGNVTEGSSLSTELASIGLDAAGLNLGAEPGEPRDLRTSLNEIAMDPDNRLVPARAFAIEALAAIENPEVTRDLLDLYEQRSMPAALRETLGEALRSRSQGTEFIVQALDQEYDYLNETDVPPLELVVPSLMQNESREALPGLIRQLQDHETPAATLPLVARAIVDLGDASVLAPLRAFLILYHRDSSFAEDPQALIIAAEGLFRHGEVSERELLQSLAGTAGVAEAVTVGINGFFEAEQAEAERLAQAEAEAAAAAAAEAARQEVAARPLRLSQRQINESIATQADPLRACITEELARNPRLAQIRITFILEGQGRAGNLSFAPANEEFVTCMTPVMDSVEFPQFRTSRQRAMFTISVRGSSDSRGTASSDVPSDAPWWAFNQARAEAIGLSTPPSERGWWMTRPRTAWQGTAATPTPAPASSGGASSSLWWMQQQPAQTTTPEETSTPETPDPSGESTASEGGEGDTSTTAESGAEGEATEGEATEGEATEGEATEGEATEGEATEGEATEGEATEGEATEGEATEGEATEGEPEETAPEEVPWWLPQE